MIWSRWRGQKSATRSRSEESTLNIATGIILDQYTVSKCIYVVINETISEEKSSITGRFVIGQKTKDHSYQKQVHYQLQLLRFNLRR